MPRGVSTAGLRDVVLEAAEAHPGLSPEALAERVLQPQGYEMSGRTVRRHLVDAGLRGRSASLPAARAARSELVAEATAALDVDDLARVRRCIDALERLGREVAVPPSVRRGCLTDAADYALELHTSGQRARLLAALEGNS